LRNRRPGHAAPEHGLGAGVFADHDALGDFQLEARRRDRRLGEHPDMDSTSLASSCRADTLMHILIVRSPASCQALACAQAVSNTQRRSAE